MPDPLAALIVGLGAVAGLVVLFYPDRGIFARWRARRSRSVEVLRQDALKFILQRDLDGEPATPDDVGGHLGLTARGTASLLASLLADGLAGESQGRVGLTPSGREAASKILRAHRLWERHLADRSGYAETEWHARADEEEHRLTASEAEALARSLDQPASDPHGDPIPTSRGEVVLHRGAPLLTLPPGTAARITHVEDEPADIYDRIAAAGLVPGAVIRLLETTPDFVRIQVNGDEARLPARAADNLAVVIVSDEEALEETVGQPLYSLHPGERARVVELSPRCRGAERRRFLDLGILPGTTVEAVMTSPGGDPTAYRIRDALIALRREQARLIRISRTPEPSA